MLLKTMSLSARRELLIGIRQTYQNVDWLDKGKVLDGLIAATGYDRKYAIRQLNGAEAPVAPKGRLTCQKCYDQVRQALISVWVPPTKFAPSA